VTAPGSVGVLGLGAIGGICARHLLKVFGSVSVYDLDVSRVAVAVDAGATSVLSASELGKSCDTVVVSLPNPPAVRDALLGAEGLFAEAGEHLTVVDMSTVDPQTTRELYARAGDRRIGYLDAPVSGGQPFNGGVDGAEAGTLTFMVGGDATHVRKARPVFDALGVSVHHLGPAGAGSTVKLISNLISGIYTLVAAEGFALGAAAGLSPHELMEVFRDTDAKSFFLTDYLWPRLETARLQPGFAVDLQLKDHRLAAELAHELGVPLYFNALAIQTYETMHRHGRGGMDVSDAIHFVAEQSRANLGLSRKPASEDSDESKIAERHR
jgi:3-hydroxyisobutyrate dehydrogenase-like beta-hydroxyacid dehydrogenase